MKKTIISVILVSVMILGAPSAFANVGANEETRSIQLQANSLISKVDENALMLDALNNVVDYSVPLSIRESIVANANFIPLAGVEQDAIELEVSSTVQKVGEINCKNGDIANIYVTAVAAESKVDQSHVKKHGVDAWALVYWIDNFGANNELVGAAAYWETNGKFVENRQVRYGTSDIAGLFWLNGPTVKYTTEDNPYYEDSSYSGLTLRCETRIDVVNVGTVICNAISGITTK